MQTSCLQANFAVGFYLWECVIQLEIQSINGYGVGDTKYNSTELNPMKFIAESF